MADSVSSALLRLRLGCLGVALFLVAALPVAAQDSSATGLLRPGDIVVIDSIVTQRARSAVVKVDPSTGAQTVLSDFGDPSQGPTSWESSGEMDWASLVLADSTAVFVLAQIKQGALVSVDPATGARTIISDFEIHSQGPALRPKGLAIERSGDFVLADDVLNALLRVDRATGMRVIFSHLNNPAQGPRGNPLWLAVEASGHIVVASSGGTNDPSVVLRVDPVSGMRTMVSDFRDPSQGPTGRVASMAIDHSGNILVTDSESERLFRLDPVTGTRTLLSDPENASQGVTGRDMKVWAVEESGDILTRVRVGPLQGPTHIQLLRVDPRTGFRTFLADISSRISGGLAGAIVPTPVVNDLVSLSLEATRFDPTSTPGGPAGTFEITAAFTNTTAVPIQTPFFRVVELSGGNLLVNGDVPPTVAAISGKGARLTPDVGTDGVLSPGESVTVVFAIGLQARQPFTCFVNVFGVAEGSP